MPNAWEGKGSRHLRGYGHAWVKMRKQAMERDAYLCQPCAKEGKVTPATECDHVTPKAQGGKDVLRNLQAICRPCHQAKTQREANGGKPVVMKDRPEFDASGRVKW